jgi:FkbM family methyltransferase
MQYIDGIFIPDGDTTFERVLSRNRGTYQLDRIIRMLPFVNQRHVAIDIGAHVGMYSRELVKYFDHVVAFEPNADNYQCLTANVDSAKFIPYNLAVGRTDGFVGLTGGAGKSVGWKVCKGDSVRQTYLDGRGLTKIDFIKIDAEGAEYEILMGALDLLSSNHPAVLLEEKHDPNKWASVLLARLGMREVWRIKNDHLWVWK